MKQSSIEWFINELDKTISYQHISKSQIFTDIIEQAKAMHKEEIVKAWSNGYVDKDFSYFDPEQYYNQTFVGQQ